MNRQRRTPSLLPVAQRTLLRLLLGCAGTGQMLSIREMATALARGAQAIEGSDRT